MVWSLETSNGMESAKIAHIAVPYLQGKGLDIGCGPNKVWPSAIGIDSLKDYGGQRLQSVDVVCNAENLEFFSDSSMDYVYSSHFLEHTHDYKSALKEWWRVIKNGGYLVLYLPHKKFYPNMGTPGSNPDHKFDFMPEDIIEAMKEIGSWELVENEDRSRWNEYSFFQVYKKKGGKGRHIFKEWERNPKGKKRALVIRYGAIGDALMVASVLPELRKQGYFVTFQCAPKTYDVLKHDPHIDEWFVQEENFVPNVELGPYWKQLELEGRWDRIINLCESIEGGLLALPDRLQHNYPPETRRKLFGVNYLERTHDIAGVPHNINPRFYPTAEEKDWAKRLVKDRPVIAWAINGSSIHKVYPYIQTVIAWLAQKTSAQIYLLGDERAGRELEDGIMACLKQDGADMTRIHHMCGKWTVRQSLSFVQQADVVVGPETGVLNSVSMESNAKVIYLSHSSPENLTKYWKNTTVLEPDKAKAPCWPCHRMIYTWDSCHQDDKTKAAACASSITAESVFDAIMNALGYAKQDNNPSGTSGRRAA
jgi:ADP-heptose:LPS heptosyltransferase/predicted SAM-dependent methyltransferase